MVTTPEKTYANSGVKDNSDIIVLLNTEGIVTYISPSITAILEYMPEEIIGSRLPVLVHPDELGIMQWVLGEIAQLPGKSLSSEYRLRCKDGSWRWFEGSITNLLHVPGTGAMIGNFHDISKQQVISQPSWSEIDGFEHFVQFCETDAFLIDSLSEFVGAGLRAGDAVIVLATQSHREGLEERLREDGLEVAAAREQGQYISVDAADTLSKLMVDGLPDAGRFAEVVGSVIAQAEKGGRRVRIFGELVVLLWADGNRAGAICLEELWNDLGKTHSFSLFCAYPMHGFNGEVYEVEFSEICRQHSRVIPAESYSALDSQDERLRAITLLQQKARSLEVEIAERKGAEQRKDEFISMASHELKTPVTSLKGFLSLLQRRLSTQTDEKSLHYLARMDAQVNKLNKLISDLLDLSKMQTGQLVYREESFEVDALVQEIVENVQGTTQTHHLLLEGRTHAEVFGDRDRIGQVLINLLNNAIKYSPEADKVLVRIAKAHHQIVVSVQDFGIGIAEEHQRKIFERFYQVTDPEEKTYPGLGIGLYISCEIVKRHGGKLWVESKKGEGSTFHFTLPLLHRREVETS